jgi:transposase
MGLERYVVDAVLIEKRRPTEIAKAHGISRSWLYELIARVRSGGYEALAPHSRRPRSSPRAAGEEVIAAVLQLRQELLAAGHDAGPQTISHHVAARLAQPPPSRSTIWRILSRHGLITPQPHKRPRSSFVRFEASLPNERWQADATDWHLADGATVEILNFVDDHSRLFVASVAFTTVKAADALETFLGAANEFGLPASLLTDNAAVFSGRSRKGRVLLESELDRLGIVSKHSTPTIRRPAARSSASTSRSSASSRASLRRPLLRISRLSSTPSVSTTTSRVLTAPSMGAPPSKPSPPESRPDPLLSSLPSSTASVTTASTRPARSPCATAAGSDTSALEPLTGTNPSTSSWRALRSGL